VLALDDDNVRTFTVDPVALGFAPAIPDELTGGTPLQNAEVVRRVMKGEHGAHRNIVLLNAAAGLVVAGVADSLEEAVVIATSSIDEGHAVRTLDRWILESQSAAADLAG
jgi:anthranilate phosphoribosyltransferase